MSTDASLTVKGTLIGGLTGALFAVWAAMVTHRLDPVDAVAIVAAMSAVSALSCGVVELT